VHEGTDVLLRRPVAIKEIRLPRVGSAAERELAEQRVMREARAAARLRHPGLVAVYDVLKADGRSWIVMEYVDGVSLSERIRERGRLAPEEVARIGISLAYALEAAHRAGVVHRDVKPGNVLVTADGQSRLTDFGIAVSHGDTTLTGAGTLVGSPAYIAPERVRGARAVPASDVWGLGATLFAAVEGAPPFDGEGVLAILTAVVEDRRHPFTHAESLRGVIDQMLVADPERRPSLAEVRGALYRVLDGLHGAGGWRRHGRRSALARRAARAREADRADPWLEILAESHQPPLADDGGPVAVADGGPAPVIDGGPAPVIDSPGDPSPNAEGRESGGDRGVDVPDADGTVVLDGKRDLGRLRAAAGLEPDGVRGAGGVGEADPAAGSAGDSGLDRGPDPEVDDVPDGAAGPDEEADAAAGPALAAGESDLIAGPDDAAEPEPGAEPEREAGSELAAEPGLVAEPGLGAEPGHVAQSAYRADPGAGAEPGDGAVHPVDEADGNAGLVAATKSDAELAADPDLAADVEPAAGRGVRPESGGSAPVLATARRRLRRRDVMIAAAVVTALAVAGTTLGLATNGGGTAAPAAATSPRRTVTVSSAPATASAPTAGSPDPTSGAVTPSASDVAQSGAAQPNASAAQDYDTSLGSLIPSSTAKAQPPAGFTSRSGPGGSSVAVPSAWSASVLNAERGVLAAAGGYPELLVETQTAAGPSAIGAWRDLEAGVRAKTPGYRLLSIRAADGQDGTNAAVWEFTFSSGGRVIHVLDLGLIRNGHGFALRWRAPEDDWAGQQDLMNRIFATFRPGP
jgi:hypothetical protein